MFLVVALLVAGGITAAAVVIDRRPKTDPAQLGADASIGLDAAVGAAHAVRPHTGSTAI